MVEKMSNERPDPPLRHRPLLLYISNSEAPCLASRARGAKSLVARGPVGPRSSSQLTRLMMQGTFFEVLQY